MISFKHQAGFIDLGSDKKSGLFSRFIKSISGANRPSKLILHNDDLNHGYWVRDQLVNVAGLSEEDAMRKMLEAHQSGQTVIFEGARDECGQLLTRLRAVGADTRFFEDAKPLNLSVASV